MFLPHRRTLLHILASRRRFGTDPFSGYTAVERTVPPFTFWEEFSARREEFSFASRPSRSLCRCTPGVAPLSLEPPHRLIFPPSLFLCALSPLPEGRVRVRGLLGNGPVVSPNFFVPVDALLHSSRFKDLFRYQFQFLFCIYLNIPPLLSKLFRRHGYAFLLLPLYGPSVIFLG